ncbi:MAG: metallophosphoesterase [Desulfonauticus sp.]|nr:metallophosphoesterase [Desulfonauticus sp.]
MSKCFWIGVGDIHESYSQILSLPELKDAKGLLISGDITNSKFHKEKIQGFFSNLMEINPHIWAQIGNMDTFEVEELLDELGINVHLKLISLTEDVYLAGVGYSTFTPFNTPSEVSEDTMTEWLKELKSALHQKSVLDKHLIFMTHTPPYNTKCDVIMGGSHVGSKAVREFIEQVQPDICFTGHIHESKAIDEIGKTLIVNPGAVEQGGYVKIIWLDDHLEVELI